MTKIEELAGGKIELVGGRSRSFEGDTLSPGLVGVGLWRNCPLFSIPIISDSPDEIIECTQLPLLQCSRYNIVTRLFRNFAAILFSHHRHKHCFHNIAAMTTKYALLDPQYTA